MNHASHARTLLIFDGYNIVRRVYGAVPGDDSPQKVEGVFRSSFGSFKRALKEFQPTHVLAVFDHGGPTFRNEMYSRYRENRKPMPEVLREAMPTFHDMLREAGIPVVIIPGVEADDVMATVSLKWVTAGKGRAVVMTTDKDMAQLVSEGVEIRDQFEERWLDAEWAMKKFGVPIEKLGDCLALMSDTVDGIPGVHKVGPKTAAKWLETYGNLEGVLANSDKITGVVGQNLRNAIDDVIISRKLVALKTDVVLNMTWNQMLYNPAPAQQQAA
jgi:DNA polymerase-1